MKTMTCKDMGGPCDAEIQGETAEELMANGGAHVEMMKDSDEGHMAAFEMMQAASEDPAKMKAWMDDFQAKFAAL